MSFIETHLLKIRSHKSAMVSFSYIFCIWLLLDKAVPIPMPLPHFMHWLERDSLCLWQANCNENWSQPRSFFFFFLWEKPRSIFKVNWAVIRCASPLEIPKQREREREREICKKIIRRRRKWGILWCEMKMRQRVDQC